MLSESFHKVLPKLCQSFVKAVSKLCLICLKFDSQMSWYFFISASKLSQSCPEASMVPNWVLQKWHFEKNDTSTPAHNWGVPRKFKSRGKCWSHKSRGLAKALELWKVVPMMPLWCTSVVHVCSSQVGPKGLNLCYYVARRCVDWVPLILHQWQECPYV